MQLSYNGVKQLKLREGFRDKAYKDTVGIWTIGYGSTKVRGVPVKEGDTITEAEAEEQFLADTAWAQTCVNQSVQVPLTQNQFDALVSLVYNIGAAAFMKSTLLKVLNLMCYDLAADAFMMWTKQKELIPRRKSEVKQFQQ